MVAGVCLFLRWRRPVVVRRCWCPSGEGDCGDGSGGDLGKPLSGMLCWTGGCDVSVTHTLLKALLKSLVRPSPVAPVVDQ
jgi:hypothetical protein